MAKAGRPREYRPHEMKMSIVKDEGRYKLKRLYWVLISMEKKMKKDITSVRYGDYQAVLNDFTQLSAELKKKGVIEYNHGKPYTGARVDHREVAKSDTEQSGTSEASGDRSSDMGAGIPTANPIT